MSAVISVVCLSSSTLYKSYPAHPKLLPPSKRLTRGPLLRHWTGSMQAQAAWPGSALSLPMNSFRFHGARMFSAGLTDTRSRALRPSLDALRGFTLLELLVVMVIIGLLAGYVGPRYFAQVGKSEVKTARAQIDALEKALDQYRMDLGHYPTNEQGLDALYVRPESESK